MVKKLLLLAGLSAGLALCGGEEPAPDARSAYRSMNYPLARKIASRAPQEQENQLILALCDLHDANKRDIPRGRAALLALYRNPAMPQELRLEAGIEYARLSQLMKLQPEIYGDAANDVDCRALLRELMAAAPGTMIHRDAFFFLIRETLEDPETRDSAFQELETFLVEFPGDRQLLTPVCLLAEYEYIRLRGDYASAVRHLRTGYEMGFANRGENRSALFRLGFLSMRKLNDRVNAKRYFEAYLERYPLSAQAVVAKRLLRELNDDK